MAFRPALFLCFLLATCGTMAPAGPHGEPESVPMTNNKTPFVGDATRGFALESAISTKAPLTITLVPIQEDTGWAVVRFHNSLVRGHEIPREFRFTHDDKVVIVFLDSKAGDLPDTITVIPPDGYLAVPNEIAVEEDESVEILIIPYLMG